MSRPSDSSSARSVRTVEAETVRPERSTSPFEPTGSPVAMYSSTTRRRISRLRSVSWVGRSWVICRRFYASSSAVTPPPRKRPRRVSASRAPSSRRRARPCRSRRATAAWSSASLEAGERERLVEAEPEQHALLAPGVAVERLRARAPGARRARARRRSAAGSARFASAGPRPSRPRRRRARGSRGRPVAEVVAGAEVARGVGAAEVRRLVPAVARSGERLDDALEVVLHRLGLPLELRAVRVREARAGLGLELVARRGAPARARAPRRGRARGRRRLWPGMP